MMICYAMLLIGILLGTSIGFVLAIFANRASIRKNPKEWQKIVGCPDSRITFTLPNGTYNFPPKREGE